MTTPITKISGVGEHTASVLIEHGYTYAEDLAAITEDALSRIPGFGPARAKQIINAAKALCDTEVSGEDIFPDFALKEPPISTIDDDIKAEAEVVGTKLADKKPTKKKGKKKKKKGKKKDKNNKDDLNQKKSKKKHKLSKKSEVSEKKKPKKNKNK